MFLTRRCFYLGRVFLLCNGMLDVGMRCLGLAVKGGSRGGFEKNVCFGSDRLSGNE